MTPSKQCIDLIKQSEGCKLKAYLDSADVWTIGYGTIMYLSGDRVKQGDIITQAQADELLQWGVSNKALGVWTLTKGINGLRQQHFDAMVSFAYNLGLGALKSSTLLQKAKVNPNDPDIKAEFLKWNKAKVKGVLKPVDGLTARRIKEAEMYFS